MLLLQLLKKYIYLLCDNYNVFFLFKSIFISCISKVGCHHRDGRAEQTYSHLPGLPRNGAKPEQLATVWVDPTASCTEGPYRITTLIRCNSLVAGLLVWKAYVM